MAVCRARQTIKQINLQRKSSNGTWQDSSKQGKGLPVSMVTSQPKDLKGPGLAPECLRQTVLRSSSSRRHVREYTAKVRQKAAPTVAMSIWTLEVSSKALLGLLLGSSAAHWLR